MVAQLEPNYDTKNRTNQIEVANAELQHDRRNIERSFEASRAEHDRRGASYDAVTENPAS